MAPSAPASDSSPPLSPTSFVSSDAQSLSSVPESSNSDQNDIPETHGKKRGRYFFSPDMLRFVVGDVEYRVHSYLFQRHSSVWADKLTSPRECSEPFVLEDVTVSDMEAFLSVLYPESLKCHDPASVAAWSGVLRLATKWKFDTIRDIAIEELESPASPLEKLVLGLALNIPKWIIPSLVALCTRPKGLTLEEARQLSLEDVLLITSVREAVWRNPDAFYVPSAGDVTDHLRKSTGSPFLSSVPSSTRSHELSSTSLRLSTAVAQMLPTPAPASMPPAWNLNSVSVTSTQNSSVMGERLFAESPSFKAPEPPTPLFSELLRQTLRRHLIDTRNPEEAARLLHLHNVPTFSKFLIEGLRPLALHASPGVNVIQPFLIVAMNQAIHSQASLPKLKSLTSLVKTMSSDLQSDRARPSAFGGRQPSDDLAHTTLQYILGAMSTCIGRFWCEIEQAKTAYGSFGLAYAYVALAKRDTDPPNPKGQECYYMDHQEIASIIAICDVAKRENEDRARTLYNERSVRLRDLLVSFADAKLITGPIPPFVACTA